MARCKVEIRLATDADNETLNSHYNDFFLRDEPLNAYMQHFKSPNEDRQILPNEGLTFLAEIFDPVINRRKFAGFLFCEILNVDQPPTAEEFVIRTDYRIGSEIFKMIEALDAKCSVFDKFDVQEVFDMLLMSVAEDCRQKSVAYHLCKAALDLAQTRGYEVALMDCSSWYTAALAKKVGMQCIGEISYEDYQLERGERLFDVKEPHTHLQRFIRCL